MGKRKGSHFTKKAVDLDKDVDDINPESQDFCYDEVDKFHAERDGLDQFGQYDSDESEGSAKEEVFGIECSDVSDEEMDDDEEEEEDEYKEDGGNGIPSSKAWGKRKSLFFGAEDVKGLQGAERDEIEDDEEEEALKIQQRLAEEIDEDQFQLFQIPEAHAGDVDTPKEDSEKVAVDVSSLSTKAQWKLLKQDSPELKELIADFKEKSAELKSTITPLLNLVKTGKIMGEGAIYVQTKFNLYMLYLVNVSFYMSLKARRQSLVGHPVIKRLLQYRTLINKLSKVDEKVEEEIEALLNSDDNSSVEEEQSVTSYTDRLVNTPSDEEDDMKETSKKDTIKLPSKVRDPVQDYVTLSERLKLQDEEKQKKTLDAGHVAEEEADELDRRAITYTMRKNKGAQAKKRKMDRNPRVKHREKYRRAKIRRRGQVQEYRPEIEKYSGEATGIRAGIIRGVRIK